MNIKRKLLTSVFAKQAKDIEALLQKRKLKGSTDEITGNRTVYCVSPFKTGTTYLSTAFDNKISDQRPMLYLSMSEFEKDFNAFFLKRLNSLNLKLECSGFFSAYIDELAAHPIAKELEYICILRSPSSWITSVINHWGLHQFQERKFEYITECFWKPKVGVDIRNVLDSNNQIKDDKAIDKLVKFYFEYTENTKKLKNMHYVGMKELEAFLPTVGKMIGEVPNVQDTWQRKTKDKKFEFKDEAIDLEYCELVSSIKPDMDRTKF